MDFTKLLGSLGNLDLSKMLGGVTDMFGNEGFKNLLGGGLGIYNAMQAGDLMDFQKDMMGRNEARSADVFQREKEDEEARKALDF
jgi:hypothetical protein